MNIDFLKEKSRMLTEEINIANTDAIINAIIEQKLYSSLAYQICEVSPISTIEGGTFALKYVDDPLFPGKKKIQLIRNSNIVNKDPIEDTGFTIETIQDLQKQYGKSAVEYIGKVFGGISARNENIKLVNDLSLTATVLPNLQADPNNAEFATYNIQQKVSEVLLLINSNSFKSLEGFCILPQKWAASILGVKNLLPEQSKELGLYLGRNSRTRFYLNPDPLSVECFVGIHSEIPGQSSLVMSPYSHTIKTAINPETGEEHVFNFNRYAITENALSLSEPLEKMLYKFEVDAVPMAGGGGTVAAGSADILKRTERFIITNTDVTNGYIDLLTAPLITEHLFGYLNGMYMDEDVNGEFTISGNRITFAAGLIQTTDKIIFKYSY